MVDIIDPNTNEFFTYYMEPKLQQFLDVIVRDDLGKKDKDYVMMVDGYEGSGKSTFASQIAKYVDPTFTVDRMCMDSEEFRNHILSASKNQAIVYDEAVTGMSATESLTKVGRMLKSLMMQMRQKNLFIIIVMPWIFEMNRYAVLGRTRTFFHVYESGGRRGYFVGYNRKDLRDTYLLGKKTFSYKVRSTFNGRFYGKYAIDEDTYRKKKEDALKKTTEEEDVTEHRWKKQRDVLLYLLQEVGLTQLEIERRVLGYGLKLPSSNISEVTVKIRKMLEKKQLLQVPTT